MKRFAILLVVLLAGCSAPDHGKVTDRQHTDAWVQIIPGQPPICGGNPPSCTPGMPMQMIPWPESWSIEITNGDDSGSRDVDRDTYNKCTVGTMFPECAR